MVLAKKPSHATVPLKGGTGARDCYLFFILDTSQTYAAHYTDKKENLIFLIYKEIQSGAVAKSYMGKGCLIYEEMRKYFPIYEEAVSHI
jgi:hypothetical protein